MNDAVMKQAQRCFATGLCLITSKGPAGNDVMAAEWTMQVSYEPMLIAVFIHEGSSTLQNIRKTKIFGVNVASDEQATLVSVAGGFSRKEVDKLGIDGLFPSAKSPSGLAMIGGCLVNAECRVQKIQKIGDHHMVVGRATSIVHDERKKPLIYHRNRYFGLGGMVEPEREKIPVKKWVFDMFSSGQEGRFIVKVAGVTVRSKNRVLVMDLPKESGNFAIPFIHPGKGADYKQELERHLSDSGLRISVGNEPRIKRFTISSKKKILRINFVLFDGMLQEKSDALVWKPVSADPFLASLLR